MAQRQASNPAASTSGPAALSIEVPTTEAPSNPRVKLAVRLSALANGVLFAAKLFAFIVSGSKAVLASLADSGVDLASQLVVFICDTKTRRVDRNYPVGKARLETVGALIIACIMTFASVLVIQSAIEDLAKGFGSDDPPVPEMDAAVYSILVAAIALKAALFGLCYWFKDVSDSTLVLAQDHKNDVISNIAVVVAAAIASSFNEKCLPMQPLTEPKIASRYWYVDPIAGISISVFIIICWVMLADKQIAKIVGLSAPEDFRDRIREIASQHEGIKEVDAIRAYHLGLRYFVEIDIVMPGSVPLYRTHDSALELQRRVKPDPLSTELRDGCRLRA